MARFENKFLTCIYVGIESVVKRHRIEQTKMETWLLILVSLFVSLLLHLLLRSRNSSSPPLPPDPNFLPFLGTLQWLREGLGGLESYLRSVHHRLGPIVTLRITSRPAIFVADRSLAHEALVLNGAVYADRPPAATISKIVDKHNISSGSYGATWRLLRRNISSEILHPSRVRSYSHARHWVLGILFDRFRKHRGEEPIVLVDYLQYSMFALLVLMCFGDKLDEKQIKEVEFIQRLQLLSLSRFNIFNIWPKFTKLILRKRWQEFLQIRRQHQDVLLPLIRARKKIVEERKKRSEEEEDIKDYVQSYVDTLLDLEVPDEKRKLNEEDIMNLCSEFLTGGTDTTATALQWIMANLVKYPEIQKRLHEEIKSVVGEEAKEVEEEDVEKMPYLKAVVLEGLRKHPPGHFLLPHSVTEDTILGGYKVPKNGTINFMVAEIGRDRRVWEEPMVFKPERFIGEEEVVDITGSRGIKMMPFGAGRRICPGIGLAMLHLEYYVANMVREFQWKEVEGHEVDLTEKLEFTVVMKHPLKALAVPRSH